MTKKQKQNLLKQYYPLTRMEQGEKEKETIMKIISLIQSMDNPVLREVLQYRYLEHKKWAEISKLMNYSKRQLYRFHTLALNKLKF